MGLDQSKRNTASEAVTLWSAASKFKREDKLAEEAMESLQGLDAESSKDEFIKWSVQRREAQTKAKEGDIQFMREEESMGKEMLRLVILSWPLILNQFSLQFLPVIDAIFSGQLVYPECMEDATVCALNVTMVANVWFSLVFVNLNAVSSGATTLCAMCYGANKYYLLSIYVQIAIVFVCILSVPIIILTMASGKILGAAGLLAGSTQEIRDVQAELLTSYSTILAIGILPKGIYMILRKYVETQGIMHVGTYVSLMTLPMNLALNTFFVSVMGWRANGVAAATASSQVIQLAVMILYSFVYKKYHKRTWKGWHISEWTWPRWKELFLQALPRMLSESFEAVYVQAIFFMSATFGTRVQACQGILVQVFMLASAPTTGFGNAVCIRVGQLLGMGRAEKAKTVALAGSYLGIMSGCAIALIIISSGDTIGRIFGPNDPAIWNLILYMRGIFSLSLFLLSTVTVNSFIMFAQGRAATVARWFLICTWGVGAPLAVAFAFARRGEDSFNVSDPPFDYEIERQQLWQVQGLHGLWQGLTWGYGGFQIIICFKMINSNWHKFVRRAEQRAEKKSDEVNTGAPTQPLMDEGDNAGEGQLIFDDAPHRSVTEMQEDINLSSLTVAEGFKETASSEIEGQRKQSTQGTVVFSKAGISKGTPQGYEAISQGMPRDDHVPVEADLLGLGTGGAPDTPQRI